MSLVNSKTSQNLVIYSSFPIVSSSDKEILVSKEIQIQRITQDHIYKLPTGVKFAVLSFVSRKVWAKAINLTVYTDLLFMKSIYLKGELMSPIAQSHSHGLAFFFKHERLKHTNENYPKESRSRRFPQGMGGALTEVERSGDSPFWGKGVSPPGFPVVGEWVVVCKEKEN